MRAIPSYKSEQFTWMKDKKVLVTCASDLMGRGDFWGRIYDDAADLGFAIVSKRTGNSETFYLAGELRDQEGDVYAWEFMPINQNLNMKVTVFND